MVGLHTFISNNLSADITDDLDFLRHEEWFEIDTLYESNNLKIVFSHYDGYPYNFWENDNYCVLIEGMIYNYDENIIKEKIDEIANKIIMNYDYNSLLREFIDLSDGDYIIQIFDKCNYKYIVFNDILGRLPLYYYHNDSLVIISREIKTILKFIPKIKFNKIGIVENLMFEYNLGNKTLFEKIFRLNPSEVIKVSINKISEIDFKTKNRFWNKEKSLENLTEIFLKSTENRVKKLQEKEYKIIADLSGGYDSRVVIGALSKFNKNVNYFTYEYIQDESKEAKKVFQCLGCPGIYTKLSFNNTFNFEELSPLIYKTDGLVNYFTTAICYNDILFLKKKIKDNIAHFGGFGGEFLRHPEKRWYRSLFIGIKNKLYSTVSINEIILLFNNEKSDSEKILHEFQQYFQFSSGQKKDEILKHFYYEYYRNLVGSSGEERQRIFHWSVMPLWNNEFVRTIFNKIPLRWTGYKYFIDFMKKIDPRLLKSPIYNSPINLKSTRSIKHFEKEYKNSFKMIKYFNYLNNTFPPLIKFYRAIKKRIKKKYVNKSENNSNAKEKFEYYYNRLEKIKDLFIYQELMKYIEKTGEENNRLTTLFMYFYEIEKRFKEKIEI